MLELWLKRRPRPAHLTVKLANGETREIALGNVRSWAQVAETVLSLEPTHVEALGPEKNLLRATRIETEDFGDDRGVAPSPSLPPSRVGVPRSAAASDPETARFQVYAELLARAYEHSTGTAFNKFVELYEASNQRFAEQNALISHLNEQIKGLTTELADLASERAEQSQAGGLEGLVSQFAAGAAMGAAPVPPMPNGKGKH